jgi:hypothetical protein
MVMGLSPSLAESDFITSVWAISDTPGRFDVENDQCRSHHGVYGGSVGITANVDLTRYGACWLPDSEKVYYLNVRAIDHISVQSGSIVRASSCGSYSFKCDNQFLMSALERDYAFDRVSVPQTTFFVDEGSTVSIPVELDGGIDGDAKIKFAVESSILIEGEDYRIINPRIDEDGEQINGLSWTYGDEYQRTKHIQIEILADGTPESLSQAFTVRITPIGVYLDDGLETDNTYGVEMGSGVKRVSVIIRPNET